MSSLVPELANGEVCFVLCDFSAGGPSYVETDPQAASAADVVQNMLAGEYEHPLRVMAVDPVAGSARDVSVEIAKAVQAAATDPMLPAGTQAFLAAQRSPVVG